MPERKATPTSNLPDGYTPVIDFRDEPQPAPTTETHHKVCVTFEDLADVCLTIVVGRRADGALSTSVQFPTGEKLQAKDGEPDLGFCEPDTVLHDVAHTLLAARLGLDRSPVLERVVDLAPLTQEQVDLEEAATFALQAWCAALRGEDPRPAIANVRASLERLS